MKLLRGIGAGLGFTGIVLVLCAVSDLISHGSTWIPFDVLPGLALLYTGVALVFFWSWLDGRGSRR